VVERPKRQLEQLTQQVDRAHDDWTARQIEAELERLAPVTYGSWKDDTPNSEARLRQIQRWRTGFRSPPKPLARLAFRHVWPVGERQRAALEPGFPGPVRSVRATHGLFLQNCSEETVRELRGSLGGRELVYQPALLPGRFVEIPWTRHEEFLARLLATEPHEALRLPLRVEFAVVRGTRRARLSGELMLDPEDGWTSFTSEDGASTDLE
jgi:hypothetical protein